MSEGREYTNAEFESCPHPPSETDPLRWDLSGPIEVVDRSRPVVNGIEPTRPATREELDLMRAKKARTEKARDEAPPGTPRDRWDPAFQVDLGESGEQSTMERLGGKNYLPFPTLDPALPPELITAQVQGYNDEMNTRKENIREASKIGDKLKGCLPASLAGAIGIIAILIWLAGDGGLLGDDDAKSEPSASASPSTSESPSPPPAAGVFAAPDPASLPPGDVLVSGTSAGPIGCITCDGQSRFLSLRRPGVVAGNERRTSVTTIWDQDGTVLEFGANASGPNRGRYGFNLFSGATTYHNGCAMEIGQTSCRQQIPKKINAGEALTIIIGEGGTLVDKRPASTGDFTVTWWFVFRPDAAPSPS